LVAFEESAGAGSAVSNAGAWYDQFADGSMSWSSRQWQEHYLKQSNHHNDLASFQLAQLPADTAANDGVGDESSNCAGDCLVGPAGEAKARPMKFHQPWSCPNSFDCSALHFGADVALLRPYQSEARAGDFDYQPTPRVWGGWTSPDGLGLRARWFEYHNSRLGHPGIDGFYALMTDVEFTDRFCVGYWNGFVTGGVRYAELEEENNDEVTGVANSIGPVIGYDASRKFLRCWYLYSVGRAALMFGDCSPAEGITFGIFELQLGTEWRRPLRNGSYWFVRGGWEGQWWSGASNHETEDFGLLGGVVSIGMNL
jgi:hypothetical protein